MRRKETSGRSLPDVSAMVLDRESADEQDDLNVAALDILERYESQRLPFILYLRSYFVVGTQGFGDVVGGLYLLQDYLATHLPSNVGILSIRPPLIVSLSESAIRASFSGKWADVAVKCPSLVIPDDAWPPTVFDLVQKAAIVVLDYQYDGVGLTAEIDFCRLPNKQDRTIILFPPPHAPLFDSLAGDVSELFTRLVCYDDVVGKGIFSHPLTKDLFDSTFRFAALPLAERSAIRFESITGCPLVTYDGTIRDLHALSLRHLASDRANIAFIYWTRLLRVYSWRLTNDLLDDAEHNVAALTLTLLTRACLTGGDLECAAVYLRTAAAIVEAKAVEDSVIHTVRALEREISGFKS